MILKRLKVQTTLGEATNCYLVEDEETKESVEELSESIINTIYESMGLNDLESLVSYTTESTSNKENNLLKELDELLS